ncbi:hypothetical protein T11_2101 [Trichinella zimbabwensis]|uniref:Uncharacterized protein n=1 Tax=Trichinella zimbabwensis TaxID=268475 RepID=A0A0V1GNA7_9BILA|nr:hypothetical protein T11_2101 [Trichinella zimbabwensis]
MTGKGTGNKVSLCSPGCPGTCCLDHVGFKLRDPPVCLLSTGIKDVCHHCSAQKNLNEELSKSVVLNLWVPTPLGDQMNFSQSYEVAVKIILWLRVTTTQGTALKGHSIRKAENHPSRSWQSMSMPVGGCVVAIICPVSPAAPDRGGSPGL